MVLRANIACFLALARLFALKFACFILVGKCISMRMTGSHLQSVVICAFWRDYRRVLARLQVSCVQQGSEAQQLV